MLVFTGLYTTVFAQSNHWFQKLINDYDPENKIEVSVERAVGQNENHPYMDLISQKDKQFVKWLYFINIHNAENPNSGENIVVVHKSESEGNSSNSLSDQPKVSRAKNGKDPIVFTIIEEGEMRYDTVNNIVTIEEDYDMSASDGWDIFGIRKAIAKKRTKGLLEDINVQGDLPKGSMSFIEMSRSRMKCGVNVSTSSAYVKIDVSDLEGNLIATLVDAELSQGWNNYKWTRGNHPKGRYQLSISVDDQTQTQHFKVK